MLKKRSSNFLLLITAIAILVGTVIGAGFLGIPYVAARSGFFIALINIIIIGVVILFINLYLGEITLRTKGVHQLTGYASIYLGKFGKKLMFFAFVFGIYAALLAYMTGIGESLSFLISENLDYTILFGILIGIFMSFLLWSGMKSLKRYEDLGVMFIFIVFLLIFIVFYKRINIENLYSLNFSIKNIFLPFGVVLFALLSFSAMPQLKIVLNKNERLMKKAVIIGSIIPIIFYALFTFIVVGFEGQNTPEVATLALGGFFIVLGIFTMSTSYLALGNALIEGFMFDLKFRKFKAWILTSILPIAAFVIIRIFNIFSFTRILSIGGIVSGGIMAILILFMIKKAKINSNRNPEYSLKINWLIILTILIFVAIGMIFELFNFI